MLGPGATAVAAGVLTVRGRWQSDSEEVVTCEIRRTMSIAGDLDLRDGCSIEIGVSRYALLPVSRNHQ